MQGKGDGGRLPGVCARTSLVLHLIPNHHYQTVSHIHQLIQIPCMHLSVRNLRHRKVRYLARDHTGR